MTSRVDGAGFCDVDAVGREGDCDAAPAPAPIAEQLGAAFDREALGKVLDRPAALRPAIGP